MYYFLAKALICSVRCCLHLDTPMNLEQAWSVRQCQPLYYISEPQWLLSSKNCLFSRRVCTLRNCHCHFRTHTHTRKKRLATVDQFSLTLLGIICTHSVALTCKIKAISIQYADWQSFCFPFLDIGRREYKDVRQAARGGRDLTTLFQYY